MEDMDKKEIIVPENNKTEAITLRFTKQENELIKAYARKKGVSKSAIIRSILLDKINNLNDNDVKLLITEINTKLDKISNILEENYRSDKKTS